MGVVYMAEQEQPVRRMVALKIIKPGMDSDAVVARFEAELGHDRLPPRTPKLSIWTTRRRDRELTPPAARKPPQATSWHRVVHVPHSTEAVRQVQSRGGSEVGRTAKW
jgi:hypothetical protein